ncbi:cytochrome-c peroxidase [Gimesia algae]|uniref:Methylamine utilization protein MauG n=1 Tax=Gimesia algae TaxID=2527971 RepID=A0A517VHI7_9PLAN|nr:cytochrome c peroxidase [Gimesia algae]QDT92479.1 Cytochrome c551 peroxidase precursor [Gimesia algae]
MNFARTNTLKLFAIGLALIQGIDSSAQTSTQKTVNIGNTWQALPVKASSPEDNPTTQEKVELGKKLFFDPRLSLTGTVSCNTCHNLMEGGDDGRSTSMGIHGRLGPRNAPTVWNSVFQNSQFWDGRSMSLEDQARGPIVAGPEMGMPAHKNAVDRIAAIPGYQAAFSRVFKSEEPVTIDNAVKAIAAFERTLITPNSAYDRFVHGNKSAMNEKQLQGMKLFDSIGCTECHSGPAFNGWEIGSTTPMFEEFPRNAKNPLVKHFGLNKDLGRFKATKNVADKHHYKVPTLRNITLTAPYLHNGAVPTLAETVRVMSETQLDAQISDTEVSSIVEFLTALEGEFPELTLPRLPSRSGQSVLDDQEPAAKTE